MLLTEHQAVARADATDITALEYSAWLNPVIARCILQYIQLNDEAHRAKMSRSEGYPLDC